MSLDNFSISWSALIIPGVSIAGIPLGISVENFISALARYAIDKDGAVYKFCDGPSLVMKCNIGRDGNGGCSFLLKDIDLVNYLKRETPALSIGVQDGKIRAIKVYDFSFSGDLASNFVYKGKLKGNVGLGNPVSNLLAFTSLEFDESEGWFYTDSHYGLAEVTGWGVPLDVRPDQCVTAICIVS
ncbi:hypothetical protein [Pseudomonas oryzihabitans]|uniref:hypothetical protein n=1 Tax=Pseudomonas oryzihabitans TaxID=47885 RepID=UPI002895BE84|nr:hypothetical protein [Pseudomonas oryzihabitans]MDT3723275.1 hypothetical protein [Pseudomonas oryzihabitans]